MALPRNNLLLRLHKWAWRQDENFLTETLAHLLQHLLDHEPELAARIIEAITKGFFQLRPEEIRGVRVRTQIFLREGTPDLEIRTKRQLAFIEVKSESVVNPEQLRKYLDLLEASGFPSTQLFLLTRYPVTISSPIAEKVRPLRWYQVAELMQQQCSRYTLQAVSTFLVEQFLSFLGAKNMTIGQVTWDMASGVRALRTLTDMLVEAANACGVSAQPTGSRSYLGVYLDGKKKPNYWIGVTFERPEFLVFWTHYRKVDKEKADRLGVGTVYEWPNQPAYGWRRELDLQSEEVHFFARSRVSQMEFLEEFLRECLETVRKIEIVEPEMTAEPDAPDEPQEPPGMSN